VSAVGAAASALSVIAPAMVLAPECKPVIEAHLRPSGATQDNGAR
jgi:hypothetical protein